MSATTPDKCVQERIIRVGPDERRMRHSWRKHSRGFLLTSVLLCKDSERPAGKLQKVVASEAELIEYGKKHAEEMRTRAEKRYRGGAAAAAAAAAAAESAAGGKKKRCTADRQVAGSDPIETELGASARKRAREGVEPRRQSTAELEKKRASVVEAALADPVLMEQILRDSGATSEAAGANAAAVHAANTRAIAGSLAALKKNCKTNIGRIAYNTALAVAAGEGDHTCDPANPCGPAHRCRPAEQQDGVTIAQRAESLGVREKTLREARARMHSTDHSIPPRQALEEGHYCWGHKKTRSDATDQRVLHLARRFWHHDSISRASGDSGKKAMWRPAKRECKEYHPRRQLMVPGDEVRSKFLEWSEYLALKQELVDEDPDFRDPGRSTFLSTRCGCLVEPNKASQCACQIHTQQIQYLEALSFLLRAVHANCDCTCSWCDGGGCARWMDMCKDLHEFSDALTCEKVGLLEGGSNGGVELWGRKPACASGKCPDCGFGKPNGIPTDCQALERAADKFVAWLRFEDQVVEDGSVRKEQQIPRTGRLGDLWEEFRRHSMKYLDHHESTKW